MSFCSSGEVNLVVVGSLSLGRIGTNGAYAAQCLIVARKVPLHGRKVGADRDDLLTNELYNRSRSAICLPGRSPFTARNHEY